MKKIIILMMISVIFIAIPMVKAYSPSIHDTDWDIYTSGDDVVKPNTTVRYRIWGTLHAGWLGVRAKLVAQVSVYTTTQWTIIYSDYVLPEGDYRGDVSFDKTFSVNIPHNAVLNTVVYLRLETLTRDWRRLVLSIVQDPSYDQLKRDYDQLKGDYNSLQSEYNRLQSEYNNVTSELDHWKNEYNELASKYNTSSSELGTSRTLNSILIIMVIVFIATTVYSIIRRPKVKPAETARDKQ